MTLKIFAQVRFPLQLIDVLYLHTSFRNLFSGHILIQRMTVVQLRPGPQKHPAPATSHTTCSSSLCASQSVAWSYKQRSIVRQSPCLFTWTPPPACEHGQVDAGLASLLLAVSLRALAAMLLTSLSSQEGSKTCDLVL